MRGYILVALILLAVLLAATAYYLYFFKKEETIFDFISEDWNLAVYIKYDKNMRALLEEFEKQTKIEPKFEEALLLMRVDTKTIEERKPEEYVLIVKNYEGKIPENIYSIDYKNFKIFCEKRENCEKAIEGLKKRKSKMKEIIEKSGGNIAFTFDGDIEDYGHILSVFTGIAKKDSLDFELTIESSNETLLDQIEGMIQMISGFAKIGGMKGIEIKSERAGNKIIVTGSISYDEIEKSLSEYRRKIEEEVKVRNETIKFMIFDWPTGKEKKKIIYIGGKYVSITDECFLYYENGSLKARDIETGERGGCLIDFESTTPLILRRITEPDAIIYENGSFIALNYNGMVEIVGEDIFCGELRCYNCEKVDEHKVCFADVGKIVQFIEKYKEEMEELVAKIK